MKILQSKSLEQAADIAIKEISPKYKQICLTGGRFGKRLSEKILENRVDISSWKIFLTDERLNCLKQDQNRSILLPNLERVSGFNVTNFNFFLQGHYADSYQSIVDKIKNNHFDISHDELQRRADIVKSNEDFFTKVSQALEDRIMNFPEPDYLEGKIYSGGFPSYRDQDLMKEFHISDEVEHLIKISRNFEDERFRLLAERIICTQHEGGIPDDIKNRYDDLIHERVQTDGKWGSVEKSLQEIEKLLEVTEEDEDLKILNATKEKILSMKK